MCSVNESPGERTGVAHMRRWSTPVVGHPRRNWTDENWLFKLIYVCPQRLLMKRWVKSAVRLLAPHTPGFSANVQFTDYVPIFSTHRVGRVLGVHARIFWKAGLRWSPWMMRVWSSAR